MKTLAKIVTHIIAASFGLFAPGFLMALDRLEFEDPSNQIFDLDTVSPFPQHCLPYENGTPPFYVFDGRNMVQISEALADEFIKISEDTVLKLFFDVNGYIMFDASLNGTPESYGYGVVRNGYGGREVFEVSPKMQDIYSTGLQFDRRMQQRDDKPTLIINMSDWTCIVLSYGDMDHGDLASD